MTHVVCQPCFGCKYTDCVVVCPVECFYEGEQILYIHPDECIDCEACVPECPVEAIFHQDNVPEDQKAFIELNAETDFVARSEDFKTFATELAHQVARQKGHSVETVLTQDALAEPGKSVQTRVDTVMSRLYRRGR